MIEWRFEYKCRRCGAIFDDGLCAGKELAYKILYNNIVHKLPFNYKHGMMPSELALHICEGCYSIGDIVGIGEYNTEEENG